MQLAGKRVLITGAGHGLGRAIALEFARVGSAVIVTDRELPRVESVVAEIFGMGFHASGYAFDVTQAEQIIAVREQLHRDHGPIDVLVNNAGTVFGGEFGSIPLDRHLATIAINLSGLIAVTHAFLPDLIARPESRLVNIASAAAVLALPLASTYAASKWGVLGFSESLREELRQHGQRHLRVSTICPSYISTGLFEGVKPARLTSLLTPEYVAKAVCRAAERGSEFVMLPRSARLLYSVASLMPRSLCSFICRRLGVTTSMTQWRGRAGR
ncbi:MAG: SDR family NAD(P)-dependent oxidoreductase [Gemmataceae bacterium]|nr:SDR family NAD(P)-dependent oxidoreductase [Gemmataceae bacterium]